MDVCFIQDKEEVLEVYRLRYEVYITELGNKVPDADHEHGFLSDDSDNRAAKLLGVYNDGKLLGSVRFNPLSEYRRDELPFHEVPNYCWEHPEKTVLASMLVVSREWRHTRVYFLLVTEAMQFGLKHGWQNCLLYAEPHNAALYHKSGFQYLAKTTSRHPLYRDVYPMILTRSTVQKMIDSGKIKFTASAKVCSSCRRR